MHNKVIHLSFAALLFSVCVLSLFSSSAYADEIYLKNNDKISGQIVEEDEYTLSVKTEAIGLISIRKEFVDRIARPQTSPKEDQKRQETKIPLAAWQGDIAAGYNTARGNTRTERFSLSALANRNRRHVDEWTFKGDLFYSEADNKMDVQKWYGMGRYAFSFGPRKAWYNFYRLEGDHDRFAEIRYRAIPAAGIGYWFFDLPQTRLLAEAALGVEWTDYYGRKKSASELVAIPRLFYEQVLFERGKFTQDVHLYPALTDSGSYRVRSESALTVSINDRMGLRLSLIDYYNSEPPDETGKNDLTLMSSLTYSFGD